MPRKKNLPPVPVVAFTMATRTASYGNTQSNTQSNTPDPTLDPALDPDDDQSQSAPRSFHMFLGIVGLESDAHWVLIDVEPGDSSKREGWSGR